MNQKDKLRMMVQLALADNKFEETERQFIREMAIANNVSPNELESLIQEELERKDLLTSFEVPISFESKLEILVDMVKMMKADGKVYLSEIKYCEMTAKKFGFKEQSIKFLSGMVRSDRAITTEWPSVEEKMRKMAI